MAESSKSGEFGKILKDKKTLYIVGGAGLLALLYYALKNQSANVGSTGSAVQTPTSSTGSASNQAALASVLQAQTAQAQLASAAAIAASHDAATIQAAQIAAGASTQNAATAAAASAQAASQRTVQSALGSPAAAPVGQALADAFRALFGITRNSTPANQNPTTFSQPDANGISTFGNRPDYGSTFVPFVPTANVAASYVDPWVDLAPHEAPPSSSSILDTDNPGFSSTWYPTNVDAVTGDTSAPLPPDVGDWT